MDAKDLRDLEGLCSSIRAFLIESTSETGGHIGANLGTVELTVALHQCFSTPDDKLIFDTGHTGYTHKILTGRKEMFSSLNSFGGMSRFLSRTESDHDFGDSSHAGNSVSLALGHSLATQNVSNPPWSIAIIGDGALGEGLALEALNHASVSGAKKLMIVVNDNGFAISPGFGAIHDALQDLNKSKAFFESLGYSYFGPVDGHDLEEIIVTLQEAKEEENRIPVVHVKTEKGHGFPPAQISANRMHYSLPFDRVSGENVSPFDPNAGPLPVEVAATAVSEAMKENLQLLCMTPSTRYATALDSLFAEFPQRCIDPGMAEQHLLSMAVGAAISGTPVIVFYQSTFLQRAYDQLIHDLAFLEAPVLVVSVRHGFAGFDHSTHHGIFDIPVVRSVPNLRLLNPLSNADVTSSISRWVSAKPPRPEVLLLPYVQYSESMREVRSNDVGFHSWQSGGSVLLVGTGAVVGECRKAAELLSEARICEASVLAVSQLKPIPDSLASHLASFSLVVTVEEGLVNGGMGEALAALSQLHAADTKFKCLGVPDDFAPPGDTAALRRLYGLDADSIAGTVQEALK